MSVIVAVRAVCHLYHINHASKNTSSLVCEPIACYPERDGSRPQQAICTLEVEDSDLSVENKLVETQYKQGGRTSPRELVMALRKVLSATKINFKEWAQFSFSSCTQIIISVFVQYL